MNYIYISIFIFSFLVSQDIAGNYQFYGLYIIHQSLARYDTPINVSDTHELGIVLPVGQLNAGEIYRTTYQGPYGHYYAQALNVILNVNFNEDGSGAVAEGSYYPTEEVEDCIADIAILPITDQLVYTSDLNANLTIPSTNILGSEPDGDHDHPSEGYNEGVPIFSGQTAGSLSLTTTEYFDLFPATPVHPTLCDGAGNCFDVMLENGETIAGGDPLPGFSGGFALKGDLASIAPLENDCADLYIEWHAIDGHISQSGLGDIIGEDEDGDGTDFDRIGAKETLVATYLNPSCSFNYPIFGDVATTLESLGLGDCIDRVDIATQGYIFDTTYSNWGNFVTYNALTGDENDDSDHDYNGTNGRIVMQFEPMCIHDINIRHMMLEFIEVGGDESCTLSLDEVLMPNEFNLDNVFPNPFNPFTAIKVTLTVSGDMQVTVYNLKGDLIKTLSSGYHHADVYTLNWDASDAPSGIYFIQAKFGSLIRTQKVMLIK